MRLDGIHHITCITADGPANAEFYRHVLGLRLVKKTVNFDVPDAYHLYYGSDAGEPGSLLTFFEFPDAAPGRAGAGSIHRLIWRVPSEASFEFWAERLGAQGIQAGIGEASVVFSDPEGLEFELIAHDGPDRPLQVSSPSIPAEHRISGFEGVRAFTRDAGESEELFGKTLGFALGAGAAYEIEGEHRMSTYAYDPAPPDDGIQGAGSVHHIAWACRPEDQPAWRERLGEAGVDVTKVFDRTYFRSIYFREPSGVLFEIATLGPGFTVDEPLDSLGDGLMLPEWHEHLRPRLEKRLRPIPKATPKS